MKFIVKWLRHPSMKYIYLLYISVVFSIISCGTQQTKNKSNVSLTHPQKNQYATYFKIYKEENFSVLVTYLNTNKTDSIIYILSLAGKILFIDMDSFVILSFQANFSHTPHRRWFCRWPCTMALPLHCSPSSLYQWQFFTEQCVICNHKIVVYIIT